MYTNTQYIHIIYTFIYVYIDIYCISIYVCTYYEWFIYSYASMPPLAVLDVLLRLSWIALLQRPWAKLVASKRQKSPCSPGPMLPLGRTWAPPWATGVPLNTLGIQYGNWYFVRKFIVFMVHGEMGLKWNLREGYSWFHGEIDGTSDSDWWCAVMFVRVN